MVMPGQTMEEIVGPSPGLARSVGEPSEIRFAQLRATGTPDVHPVALTPVRNGPAGIIPSLERGPASLVLKGTGILPS